MSKASQKSFLDLLPYSDYLGDNYVVCKNGGFLAFFEVFFPDPINLGQQASARIEYIFNRMLMFFSADFSLWVSMQRHPIDTSGFFTREQGGAIVERFWKETTEKNLFLSSYHLVLFSKDQGKGLKFSGEKTRNSKEESFAFFKGKVADIAVSMKDFCQLRPLNYGQILTHLYQRIFLRSNWLSNPYDESVSIDSLLGFSDVVLGPTMTMLNRDISVLSLSHLGNSTSLAHFNAITRLPFPYLISTRFLPIDRVVSDRMIEAQKRKIDMMRFQFLPRLLSKREVANPVGMEKHIQIEDAETKTAARDIGWGLLSAVILIPGNKEERQERIAMMDRELARTGVHFLGETINAPEAMQGTWPGRTDADFRRSFLSTGNIACSLFLGGVYNGERYIPSLYYPPNSPCLCLFETASSPFFFNIFVGDVGHTLIVGPTGSGKSVLLGAMIYGTQQYPDARVVVFDKGRSLFGVISSLGGAAVDAADISCNPLALLRENFDWALSWLESLYHYHRIDLSIEERQHLRQKAEKLLQEEGEPNLKKLEELVQLPRLCELLRFYINDTVWGKIFSSTAITMPRISSFDLEFLFDKPDYIIYPLLDYLLFSIPLDGKPTYIFLDEAWFFLRDQFFCAKIVDWLKTARKKNAAVVMATPSEESFPLAVQESCFTKIFTANFSAKTEAVKKTYFGFGLDENQISIISRITSKSEALFTSPLGQQIFQIIVGSTCLFFAQAHPDFWAAIKRWRDKGPNWAVDMLAEYKK